MVLPTLVLVREALRHAVRHEFEQVLLADAKEIGLLVQELYPDSDRIHHALERKDQGHALSGWFVELYDGDGQLLWASAYTVEDEPAGLADGRPAFRDV